MPNWCQNEITISGDEKKVKEFIKFVSSKKSKFDFNKIYPMGLATSHGSREFGSHRFLDSQVGRS